MTTSLTTIPPAIDAFIEALDLSSLGFDGMHPEATGRPSYHPSTLLKIYVCGYLNRIQSSRRLERETQRNLELIWLTGRLSPVFKTIGVGSGTFLVSALNPRSLPGCDGNEECPRSSHGLLSGNSSAATASKVGEKRSKSSSPAPSLSTN
jgi:hypothetical protein